MKVRTIKFPEENIGQYLYDLGVGKGFLDKTQKVLIIKGKIMNENFITFKVQVI